MAADYTVTYRRYDEVVVPGKPLGRHYRADSRSAAYPYRAVRLRPVVDTEHIRHAPIFDQGDTGSCTGEMEAGAVACDPLYQPVITAGFPPPDQQLAVKFYSEATALDGYPGTWPPDDTGSDGTAACQAAKNDGYISGYLHATTLDGVLQALLDFPVGLGFDWYDSMDEPDSSGLISISKGAQIRGGHETVWRRIDAARRRIGGDNSWGPGWGPAGGSMWLSFTDLERLLAENGDAVVPQPLGTPVTPVPVSPVTAYLSDGRLAAWAASKPRTYPKQQYQWLRASVNP